MTFLLRYWKPLAVLVAMLAVAGAIKFYGASQYRQGATDAKAEIDAQVARERDAQRVLREEIEREHQTQVSSLKGRINKLLRRTDAIRMCEPPADVPGTTGQSVDGAGNGSTLRAGPDLQPRLVSYGGQCEALRQQLIALRAFYSGRN